MAMLSTAKQIHSAAMTPVTSHVDISSFLSQERDSSILEVHSTHQYSFPDGISMEEATAFYLNAIKSLEKQEIDDATKVQLLQLLQENVCSFAFESDTIGLFIGSLKSQLSAGKKSNFLNSQILVTMVTVLLSQDIIVNSLLDIMLQDVKQMLLTDVIGVKIKKTLLHRTVACECLQELELHYPGILTPDVEDIWRACVSPKNKGFESLPVLLALILHHLIQITNKSLEPSDIATNTMKRNDVTDVTLVLKEYEIVDMSMFLLDASTSMPSISSHNVLRNLMDVMQVADALSPSIFKYWVPKLISSSEVALFHLAISMQLAYQNNLYTEQEEHSLYHQLQLRCHHPSLSTAHRLLFLEWAESLTENMLQLQMPGELCPFLPGPYDGPDLQEKKIRLLVACVQKSSSQKNNYFDMTKMAVNNMKERLFYARKGRNTSGFFRSLYCVFVNTSNVFSAKSYLLSLLCSLVTSAPWLMDHILNFVECIRKDMPSCEVAQGMYEPLVKEVLSLSNEDAKQHLSPYMQLLKHALQDSPQSCNLNAILRFIMKILQSTDVCSSGDWIVGNNIVSTCKAFLCHSDIEILYSEFAELLHILITRYENIDVTCRAKMLYSAYASLSLSKVQELFGCQHMTRSEKAAFSSIDNENTQIGFNHCIRTLKTSPLILKRISELPSLEHKLDVNGETDSNFKLKHEDLEKYFKHISSREFQAVISHLYNVSVVKSNDSKFNQLYGVTIFINGEPSCKAISDIEIPVLISDDSTQDDPKIKVDLELVEPRNLILNFRVVFSSKDGVTYTCDLQPQEIEFEHIFLPLPHPHYFSSCPSSVWKQQLFAALWDHISARSREGDDHCQESVCRTNLGKQNLKELQRKWNKFIIPSSLDNDDGDIKIGVFLAPKYHLLMHLKMLDEAVTAFFVTDNHSVLFFVDKLFGRKNRDEDDNK